MKKVLFTFALLLATLTAGAQDIELTPEGAYERKEVVTVDSASAAVLYDRAMIALTDWTGPDGKAKAGIDYQNQETHTVVYKGRFSVCTRTYRLVRFERYANFTVKVRCKDGRAQVTVTIPTLTIIIPSNGRTQTSTFREVISELKKASEKQRERGEATIETITDTADDIHKAMLAALKGLGNVGDDDF